VVGHDGSDGADFTLSTALELASDLRAPVVIVRAWSIATAPRPPGWEFGYVPPFDEVSLVVRDQLVKDVAALVEPTHLADVGYRAVHASPARSLIEISRGARMLAVGSRGLGGLAGMVLGSVSDQCVRHATCPVLVVRPRTPQSTGVA
jgi:nucleotide-binding universal stress UspA family protein